MTLLRWPRPLEVGSEHPLGEAIVAAARTKELELPAHGAFDSVTGQRDSRRRSRATTLLIGNGALLDGA